MAVPCCELGRITSVKQQDGSLVTIDDHYTANAFQGESVRPRFVLQVRRHVTSYADLTDAERRDLGRALALLTHAVEHEPGVSRVYVQSFNETAPGHLHWHVVPRFADEPAPYGPGLEDLTAEPAGFSVDRVLASLRAIAWEQVPAPASAADPSGSKRRVLDSPLTDALRTMLEFWNRRLSLYRPFRKLVGRRGDPGELYVVGSVTVLSVLLIASALLPLPAAVAVAACVIATYRALDIVIYALTIVLMTRQSRLQSVARSILLFSLNLLELALIAAIAQVSVSGEASAALWAFGVGGPTGQAVWPVLITRLQSLTSFVVMSLALATVLSKVSASFDDDSAARYDWIRSR